MQVIFDYKNKFMIWENHCYKVETFGQLIDLEKEFLEAAHLPTKH